MKAVIVSIGDELVLGQVVDRNAGWLSCELAGMGIAVSGHVTVGDDEGAIAGELVRCGEDTDVVIVTGGLGPTEDDVTRKAVAGVLGVELVLNSESMERIEGFFARGEQVMPERNRVQAMIPVGCEAIANPVGTAAGISARIGQAQAYFLPGVPLEMREMFLGRVKAELLQKGAGGAGVMLTRTLQVVGMSESELAERVGELMARGCNPRVNSTVCDGMIGLHIHASANNTGTAGALIEPVEQRLRELLGRCIYGSDGESLSEVVGRLLLGRGASVAVAESCTGGLLAKTITDAAGSSAYFDSGWVGYGNEAKQRMLGVDGALIERHGAVSEEVAGALAGQARRLAQSDYALGITGIAGPGGGSDEKPVGLVYIGLADAGGVEVRRYVFGGDRGSVRQRAVNRALDMLRLKLM